MGLDGSGRVVRVRGFRGGDEASGGDFLGISWLSEATVRGLPREGCLIGDVLGPALQRGARIGSATHDGPWDDLGSPASYLEANLRWLRDRERNVYLGASAVAPPGTTGVLGRGAILRGAPGRDVVLWPGAEASSLPPRSIVTTAGRIVTVP